MGQIKYIASIMMLVVFAIAVVSYVTNFAIDNDSPIDISDDPRINVSDFADETDTFRVQVNSSQDAFDKSTIDAGDETTSTGGVFKALKGMTSSAKSIIGMGNEVIFGSEQGINGPGIALTALGTFIVVVAVLLIWKTWAGKNPE